MRLGRAKRPYAKEVLHGMLFPTAHGRDRKILKGVGEARQGH